MKRIVLLLLVIISVTCNAQVTGRYTFYKPLNVVEIAPPDSFMFTSVQPASISQVSIEYTIYSGKSVSLDWGNGIISNLTEDNLPHTVTSNYSTANTTYYPRFTGDISCIHQLFINYQDAVSFDYAEFSKLTGLKYLNTFGSNATSSGSIASLPAGLEWCILGSNTSSTITGTLDDLPKTISYLYFITMYGVTGSFADLPDSLEFMHCWQMNGLGTQSMNDLSTKTKLKYIRAYVPTLTGSIDNLPKGLVVLNMFSNNDAGITGSIDNLSKSLTNLLLYSPNITGDVRNLSGGLLSLTLEGNVTATAGVYPRWSNTVITLQCGWTTAEVDAFLNGWVGTCGRGSAARTIDLAGTNQARSSASDAAFSEMDIDKNKTFVMTP